MSKINETAGSTIDLVKAAQSREYMTFEDQALSALRDKLQANPVMKEKLAKLNVAQGLAESDDEDKDDKEEKSPLIKDDITEAKEYTFRFKNNDQAASAAMEFTEAGLENWYIEYDDDDDDMDEFEVIMVGAKDKKAAEQITKDMNIHLQIR